MIGTIVSHYRILEHLGGGGMGVVYKAEDLKLMRTVALKFLPAEWCTDDDARERFFREAQAASALDHPNICTVHEIDETDEGRLFIAMACYDGETVKQMIARGPLPIEEAVRIAIKTARGLERAHAAGIIHRDIKPANIITTTGGEVKILDFGLAKSAGQQALTRAGSTMGTPFYMSPEQARGEDVGPTTDVWSLGVVLYEMLSGTRPFRADNHAAVVRAILDDQPRPLRELRSDTPPMLERTVHRAMAKNAGQRHLSAESLIADLQALQAAESEAGVETVTTGGADLEKPRPDLSIVVLPFDNLSPDPDQEYFSDGLTEEIISDLAKVSALRVISRTSAMHFKVTDKDLRTIGRELNVRYVLEGSVRRAGNNLRITAQLIDAGTDIHLWAEKYTGTLDDIFDIQEKVSRSIVESLEVVLAPSEERRLAARPLANVRAYDCYLRAKQGIFRFSESSLHRAVEQLETAFDLVGESAELLALMGQAYAIYFYGAFRPTEETLQKAEDYANRALRVNPEVAQVHFTLGYTSMVRGRLRDAIRHYQKGLSLDFDTPQDVFHLAFCAACFVGRPEISGPLVERVLQVDPLSPHSYLTSTVHHVYGGDFEAALEPARTAFRLDPGDNNVRWGLFLASIYNDTLEEVAPAFEEWHRATPHPWFEVFIWVIAALRGEEIAISDSAWDVCWEDAAGAACLASVFSFMGRMEEALKWLGRAVELGFINYPFVAHIDPFLGNLRRDPRSKDLLERIKHEWESFEV